MRRCGFSQADQSAVSSRMGRASTPKPLPLSPGLVVLHCGEYEESVNDPSDPPTRTRHHAEPTPTTPQTQQTSEQYPQRCLQYQTAAPRR